MATRDDDRFVYIYDYADPWYVFQLFIGTRGDGKTYGGLGGAIEEEDVGAFMYSRVTDKEWKILLDRKGVEGANPFKKYNKNNGTNYGLMKINEGLAGIYDRVTSEDGRVRPHGAPIGYSAALYNIADIRGQDFDDVTDWLLDEFVPEKHKRALPDMADAMFNAYETINRNRELEGRMPVRFWGMANSNNIYNDMFKGLGIVADVEKMQRKGQTDKYYKDRRLAIHLLKNSPIFEEQKRQTALYALTKGTAFQDMALNNAFAYDDFSLVGWRKLKDYRPLISFDIRQCHGTVYQRKGGTEIYISYAPAKYTDNYNVEKEHERLAFKARAGAMLYAKYIAGKLTFESYELKAVTIDLIAKR